MWILADQLEALLGQYGIAPAVGPNGAGLRLDLAVEPPAGTIRIEARAVSGCEQPPDGAAAGAVEVDVRYGLWESHLRELLGRPELRGWAGLVAPAAMKLWDAFFSLEMLRLEAVLVPAGSEVLFRRGRAFCDDNALFRNPRAAGLVAPVANLPAQVLKAHGVDYVELGGAVGLLSVGAGETMAVMDLLDRAGSPAACFMDVSGGFGTEAVAAALAQIAALPSARVVLVNIFGGITRVDLVAESIVEALGWFSPFPLPLVVRLEGTQAERGRQLLAAKGLKSLPVLRDAIEAAVRLARGVAA